MNEDRTTVKTAASTLLDDYGSHVDIPRPLPSGSPKKSILFVAYHFPPQSGSSGLLRSLKFCRYLPETGWLPTVLTVNQRAYERVDRGLMGEIPPEVKVVRSFALDTRRHLSIRGRYVNWMALPDRWVSWCFSAVLTALFYMRRRSVDVIFTTFPIATAVLIGLILHRITRKPWVVDFRDSMTEDDYPRDARTRHVYRMIEAEAIKRGSLFLFTATSTIDMYLKRYPELKVGKCILLPNGYDEDDFRHLDSIESDPISHARPITLLHSGLVYPEERDPRPLFQALARMKAEGRINKSLLTIVFRAPGCEEYFRSLLRESHIEDVVRLLPPIPYREALEEAKRADALLLFQGASCSHQIPAKAYEYLRLRRPILALTTHEGDTATLLRDMGGTTIVDMYDPNAIYRSLVHFLDSLRHGDHPLPNQDKTTRYARRNQAHELSEHLTKLYNETRYKLS